jgi:hypothetical protein
MPFMEGPLVVQNFNDDVELADGDPEAGHAAVVEVPGILGINHGDADDDSD